MEVISIILALTILIKELKKALINKNKYLANSYNYIWVFLCDKTYHNNIIK